MQSNNSYTPGVRLGIDFGQVRIGVARCDSGMILAMPVTTVLNNDDSVTQILDLAEEVGSAIIYVGNPINLHGSETQSTVHAKQFARMLAIEIAQRQHEIQVRLIDERLTTVSAAELLRESGKDARSSKHLIDQASAVQLLELAMDVERKQGTWAGTPVLP